MTLTSCPFSARIDQIYNGLEDNNLIIHFIFEAFAYLVGAQIYWRIAKHYPQPPLVDRFLLLGSAIFGAFLGSKFLHILEHLPFLLSDGNKELWLSGKTVLGGFIGGTLAVELAKKAINWQTSTGDAWVIPLTIGLMIGRLGCQFSDLNDLTYGIATQLPWGWNYGDNIPRHPVGLYEIIAVGLFTIILYRFKFKVLGIRFAYFMAGYCLIRVLLDFLKPPFGGEIGLLPVASYLGLSAIQWAGILGILYFLWHAKKLYRQAMQVKARNG